MNVNCTQIISGFRHFFGQFNIIPVQLYFLTLSEDWGHTMECCRLIHNKVIRDWNLYSALYNTKR